MRILVIPDCQTKPNVDISHLDWIGKYAVDVKPDVIVNIGDFWDMPSLSSYDKGTKSFEGRRYKADIDAGNIAMANLMFPINKEIKRLKRNKKKLWNPRKVFCIGNHEQRIVRAVEKQPELEGLISYNDLALGEWEVHDFLEPVIIEQVAFSHYFTSGVMGRPVSSARALLNKQHMSCVMGHVQGRDIAYGKRADQRRLTALFVGICYQQDEDYLGRQGNSDWRGIWVLNEVRDGSYDEMPVSLDYLRSKYGS